MLLVEHIGGLEFALQLCVCGLDKQRLELGRDINKHK